jgi:hypothetical protein
VRGRPKARPQPAERPCCPVLHKLSHEGCEGVVQNVAPDDKKDLRKKSDYPKEIAGGRALKIDLEKGKP